MAVGAVLDKQLETFERNGLGLPKEEREKLKALKKSTHLQPLHLRLLGTYRRGVPA